MYYVSILSAGGLHVDKVDRRRRQRPKQSSGLMYSLSQPSQCSMNSSSSVQELYMYSLSFARLLQLPKTTVHMYCILLAAFLYFVCQCNDDLNSQPHICFSFTAHTIYRRSCHNQPFKLHLPNVRFQSVLLGVFQVFLKCSWGKKYFYQGRFSLKNFKSRFQRIFRLPLLPRCTKKPSSAISGTLVVPMRTGPAS